MNYANVVGDAFGYVRVIFAGFNGRHDEAHTLRVYKNALKIAKECPGCDMDIVSLAALMHDVDDVKLFETHNNANARYFLEGEHVDKATIEKICKAINEISFSRNNGRSPSTLEGQIVQDAVRLDSIGAIGIARVFSHEGRSYEDSIARFDQKLLLLKDLMNTPKAKEMAIERHDFMVKFLEEFKKEVE
ncbi:MAG TPA: phosphohydrolase [Sphaerochaeta sp.]|jgi:uncharacterized protein|nr:phosphohydrolase [Sphaerochaeta sp.]